MEEKRCISGNNISSTKNAKSMSLYEIRTEM